MKTKLTKALCVLFAVVLAVGMLPLGANAEPERKAAIWMTPAYIFSEDNIVAMECLFYDDLPLVPYINPIDYLNVIYTDEFTLTDNGGGVYTVTSAYGEEMIIDAAKETIYFDNYDSFSECNVNQEGSSVIIPYVEYQDSNETVAPHSVTLDLASYGLDIVDSSGAPYVPLAVIAAMFSITYNNAFFFDGHVCFIHTFDPESYIYDFDASSKYQSLTRSKEMADFNYGALCLYMDCFYGRPSNALIAEMLAEKGLDAALDSYDDVTPVAKSLLLSEDMVDYFTGLALLDHYCDDGGHTCISNIPINAYYYYQGQPLADQWGEYVYGDSELAELVRERINETNEKYNINMYVGDARANEYARYEKETVKKWGSGAYLIVHGDTAVFVFDSFEIETPYNFKEALDIAKDRGVKVFIVDDSCNGGGYVSAFEYILTIISNAQRRSNEFEEASLSTLTGSVVNYTCRIDLDLDGDFDDDDKDVAYDFDFAILTSKASFSCGNELPVGAHERGIMLLGETSGGGSCNVTERYLPDGYAFPISDISKSVLPDGGDVDLGAPVDRDMTRVRDDGTVDYSGLYNIDHLSMIVKRFYTPLPCTDAASCPSAAFTDVKAKGHWSHDPIDWALVGGITAGTSAVTFSPDMTCTRAQIVTFLWRAAGSPIAETEIAFADVAQSAYYYKAVQWAVSEGITAGTSATTFSPDKMCTRAEAMTFLWRASDSPVIEGFAPFTDVAAGAWYAKPVQWALSSGVTAGTTDTTFSPDRRCTRAEIVTFIWRADAVLSLER